MSPVPWENLRRSRVLFGHQSVGEDVVRALSQTPGFPLEVRATTDPRDFQRPVFGHFRVGRNGDPVSKCRAFAQVMARGVGDQVDIAFFKLCYVDVTSGTDVERLFRVYVDTMAELARAYSEVTFLHVTVPVRRLPDEPMGWLRERVRWIGKERAAQVKRHAYNRLLRAAFAQTGRVFDLAAIESTFPNGIVSSVLCRGEGLPSLVPAYTDDGGHLNQHAAALVAEHLAARLASVAAHRKRAKVGGVLTSGMPACK